MKIRLSDEDLALWISRLEAGSQGIVLAALLDLQESRAEVKSLTDAIDAILPQFHVGSK